MMSNLLLSVFDTLTMTNYFRLGCSKVENFRLEKYFRLEVAKDEEEFDEYVRLEVDDLGNVEETIGLGFDEIELEEVVGLEVVQLPDTAKLEEVVGVEISVEKDYDEFSNLLWVDKSITRLR
jgi:hypothetical protein